MYDQRTPLLWACGEVTHHGGSMRQSKIAHFISQEANGKDKKEGAGVI